MTHLHPSNKGWLRQYIPQPTHDQLQRFERYVDQAMQGIKNPNQQQIEKGRLRAYRLTVGAVA